MSYLHSRGIIHADLKSKNIFFENDSKVVITDFGHLRLAAGLSVEKTRYLYLGLEAMAEIVVGVKLPVCRKCSTYRSFSCDVIKILKSKL